MSRIDAAAIRSALNPASVATMTQLDVFDEIDSTNAWLMTRPAPDPGMQHLAIADHQTAGRGRGGKRWLSAPGSSLCLSIAHTFESRPANLSALTLAVGVAAVRALRGAGVEDVKLKWPNDIVAADGKLGGMLAESHRRSEPGVAVVIGIGVNLELPPEVVGEVDSDWAHAPIDLESILGHRMPRELLAAAMIDHIVDVLPAFEAQGFSPFAESWRSVDWLHGRAIAVDQSGGTLRGTACGIDSDGALLLRDAASTTRVISGSIRLDGAGSALP